MSSDMVRNFCMFERYFEVQMVAKDLCQQVPSLLTGGYKSRVKIFLQQWKKRSLILIQLCRDVSCKTCANCENVMLFVNALLKNISINESSQSSIKQRSMAHCSLLEISLVAIRIFLHKCLCIQVSTSVLVYLGVASYIFLDHGFN